MQTIQDETRRGLCPRCGKEKRYTGHDFDDDYRWKYDNWRCECGAMGFDAFRISYSDTCWEVD